MHTTFSSSYLAILDELSVVKVSGKDAHDFLSNQFAGEIHLIGEQKMQQIAWCDPKGRVLFLPWIIPAEDGYLCVISADSASQFSQRLKMFVLRSQVTIEVKDDSAVIGFKLAEKDRNETLGNLARTSGEKTAWWAESAQQPGFYIVICPTENLNELTQTIALNEDRRAWLRDQIISGTPSFNAGMSGKYLPQNLNLDALGGISFTKGCYPGQEIIARLKYRGKVKERLYSAFFDPQDGLSIGDGAAVYSDAERGNKIGHVLYSQSYAEAIYVALILNVEETATLTEVLIDDVGASFQLITPPYSLPS